MAEQNEEQQNETVTMVEVEDSVGNKSKVPAGVDGVGPVTPDNPSAKAFYSAGDKARHEAFLEEGISSEGDDYGVDQLDLGDRGFDGEAERETSERPLGDDGKDDEAEQAKEQAKQEIREGHDADNDGSEGDQKTPEKPAKKTAAKKA